MGWPHKRWIDTLKERLKKRGLDFGQARRMVHDREKWGGGEFVWGVTLEMNL